MQAKPPNDSHPSPHSRIRARPTRGRRISLYISGTDEDVWTAAEHFARQRGVSLSSVVADALARYLANPPEE